MVGGDSSIASAFPFGGRIRSIISHIKHNPLLTPVLFLVDCILLCLDAIATSFSAPRNPKKACVVKLDKVGDYILVRNFFQVLAASYTSKGMQLTVIANSEIRFLADEIDHESFRWLWIDINAFSTNPLYRFRMARKIANEGFAECICSTYARNLVLDDFVVRATRAPIRLGQVAHHINMKSWERVIGDRMYTSLVCVSDEIEFEFVRNRAFFEKFFNQSLIGIVPEIDWQSDDPSPDEPYCIVAPGAGDPFRQWQPQKFAAVCNKICSVLGLRVFLLGSPREYQLGEQIIGYVDAVANVTNLIGKVKTSQLLALYQHARFILCNESGSTHIAAALGKKTVCISNANHYGKFTEYPEELGKVVHYVYPPELSLYGQTSGALKKAFDDKSPLDINTIDSTVVFERIGRIQSL